MKIETLKSNAPIILYLAFYGIFSLIGITLYFSQNELYLLMYERATGVSRPILSIAEQKWNLFLITYIVPLIFVTAFYTMSKKLKMPTISRLLDNHLKYNQYVCLVLYLLVSSFVLYRIFSVIDLQDLFYAYTNYNVMIQTRFILFDKLSRWDWLLIYSCIPTLTGLLYYKLQSHYLKLIVLVLSSIILFYTMQKRYILLMFIFVYFVGLLQDKLVMRKVLMRSLYMVTALTFIFFVQTFLPVSYLLSNKDLKTNAMVDSPSVTTTTVPSNIGKQIKKTDLNAMNRKINTKLLFYTEKGTHVFFNFERNLYFFIGALINRTSTPMVYFFELFPYQRDYLGNWLGCFLPHYHDDTALYEGNVVWKYTNGDMPGCLAAPFNFSLFARVGVWGTLIITLIYGLILGAFWAVIQSLKGAAHVLLTPMMYILMIYISMDNLVYSAFSSYGIFWWVFSFFFVCLASRLAMLISIQDHESARKLT